jgi:hypothetical protein
MIKKYEQFILEKVKQTEFDTYFQRIDSRQKVDQFDPELNSEKSYMERMRKDFANKIRNLSEYFDSFFSNLASSNGNPEEDFEEMQKIIDKTGFTLDVIKKLFSKKVCQLTSEYFPYFIHQNRLDIINGYVDIYLYMINEKLEISKMTGVDHQIDFGGQGFDKSMDAQEWIIKYAYGYHKTPYGQLFIKQLGLTPDQFVEYTFMNIKEYFDDQMRSNFAYELTKIKKPYDFDKGDIDDFDWSKFIQVDDDGFIVYYNEMENDIIENHGDFGGIITEELLKKLIMECFREIKEVIKIHDSGEYFHFHE